MSRCFVETFAVLLFGKILHASRSICRRLALMNEAMKTIETSKETLFEPEVNRTAGRNRIACARA